MKIFKKTKKQRDERIVRHVAAAINRLSGRLRLHERLRLANRWAGHHRTRTLFMTVGFLLLSLLVGILLTVSECRSAGEDGGQDPLQLGSITTVAPLFDGFHRIQDAKSLQDRQVLSMVGDGSRIKGQLDSLVALPVKSHDDSVAIVTRYHQLEFIVKSIKEEKP